MVNFFFIICTPKYFGLPLIYRYFVAQRCSDAHLAGLRATLSCARGLKCKGPAAVGRRRTGYCVFQPMLNVPNFSLPAAGVVCGWFVSYFAIRSISVPSTEEDRSYSSASTI